MTVMPSLFISHGAPDMALIDQPASRFLRGLGRSLPRPRAVVIASAHWTSPEVLVGNALHPATIHDFGGFAPELRQVRYHAPGDPALAAEVVSLLAAAGVAAGASARGLDHGMWVPLQLLFPDADVPVVPLSVQPEHDGNHHLAVGAALAPLRSQGVLVIGSGAATHNLSELEPGSTDAPAWVASFDDWMVGRAVAGDLHGLAAWDRAPQRSHNHPSPEHWLPVLVAAGAGGGAPGRLLHSSTTYGVLRMTMLAFGGDASA